ncbi:hypothetical protein AB7M17_000940 [Bradyrhizobium sp. USDA 377]
MRRRDNRWAGKHPAFPARWFDGLCLLSPEPSSFWPPSPRELTMPPGPVEPRSISARLDRSNDGQDHMVLPYASARLRFSSFAGLWRRPSARSKTSRGSSRPGPAFACPTLPRPPHPDPRSLRRTIAPLRGPGWRDTAVNPNFGKVEYFRGRGLTGFGCEAGVLPDGQIDVHGEHKPADTSQRPDAEAPPRWAAQVRLILPFDCR